MARVWRAVRYLAVLALAAALTGTAMHLAVPAWFGALGQAPPGDVLGNGAALVLIVELLRFPPWLDALVRSYGGGR